MNNPARKELDELFTIEKPAEIRGLLRRLNERRCLFTVHLDGGTVSMLTAIIDISMSQSTLLLDASADAAMNRNVAQARTLLFHTQMDQVEVRFRTGPATPVMLNGLPAFRVALPEQLYYLQQREFFRLKIPVARPVHCEISLASDVTMAKPVVVQARALDISVGGVALALTASQAEWFVADTLFDACLVTLPDSGPIRPRLKVCHVSRDTDARGAQRIQAGCQFIKPTAAMQAVIQRYIMRVERERIARDRGVA